MEQLFELLDKVKTVAIFGHVRSDGDCVGSVLGTYLYLKKNRPALDISIYLDEPSKTFSFLKGYDEIKTDFSNPEKFDLCICLDTASKDRLGKAEKYFNHAGKTANIDHHISNTYYAEFNHVEGNSSSASEVVFGLMDPKLIDKDIAVALYTGIVFDTGVFKYSSTTPHTMLVLSQLMKFDFSFTKIIDDCFYAKSFIETKIMGYALMKSQLTCDGKIIYTSLTRKEIDDFGAVTSDLEGIVAQLNLTKEISMAIFAYETPAGSIKFSFRSNEPVNVNKIAVAFGGGGHLCASGCTLSGSLEDNLQKVLEEAALSV